MLNFWLGFAAGALFLIVLALALALLGLHWADTEGKALADDVWRFKGRPGRE